VGRPKLTLVADEPDEHELQISCTGMFAILLLPDVQWTACDLALSLDPTIGRNGRPIGLIQAAKRKARGCRAGVPDYLFWHRGRGYAIELKRNADEPLSDDQKAFIGNVERPGRPASGLLGAGVPFKICWTKPQVAETLREWGLTRPFKVMA
jgi:VRR-NUC domain